MKSNKAHMSYIHDILDAKAAQIEQTNELPNVSPSVVINLPGEKWKPMILAFASREQMEGLMAALGNIAFALAIGHKRNSVPRPDVVTMITPAEIYHGDNDEDGNPLRETRERQGFAITALSMASDRHMLFSSRNIMNVWDEEKGIVKKVEVNDDRVVAALRGDELAAPKTGGDDEPDFFINEMQEVPLLGFWDIYEASESAYDQAEEDIRKDMDKTARDVMGTVLPWLLADGTLNHINPIGHEL